MMTPEEHRRAMHGLCIAHITDPASNRMRTRTAKEQHAEALAALKAIMPFASENYDEDFATPAFHAAVETARRLTGEK